MDLTTTYCMIRAIDARIKVIQGSQGAGKNIAIAQILYADTLAEGGISTVMSDTYDNLKDGAIQDFKDIYEDGGMDWESDYNKSSKDLTVGEGVIQFRYISDSKEMAGKSKRRKRLYLNEGNKFGWEVASTYIGRTHGDVYIDFNPDYEFWAHTQIPLLKDLDGNPISERIIVTYKHNERCPESEIEYIESRRGNKEWYDVYGRGITGTYSTKQIYRFNISDVPEGAARINSGMDFGQSPDPTILVDAYIKGVNLYLQERFCENNLLAKTIKGAERISVKQKMDEIRFPHDVLVVGDTSGKASILEMAEAGYTIMGVKKNRPVYAGINALKAYNIHATPSSNNLIEGFKKWLWKTDHNGKIIPEPKGHEPDGLAAARYLMMYFSQK